MRIVFASAEFSPYSKVGGLGDACGELAVHLAQSGNEVTAFVPATEKMVSELSSQFQNDPLLSIKVPVGADYYEAHVYELCPVKGLRVLFIVNSFFFAGRDVYGSNGGGYEDNHRRFIFFSRVVVEVLSQLAQPVDVLHCHDWHTALIPVYVRGLYVRDKAFRDVSVLLSIHNLCFQGIFNASDFHETGLGWREYASGLFEYHGKVNLLKAGLITADRICAVSPNYASEIMTKSFGCGLEKLLQKRVSDLSGIVNGISYDVWNPEKDKAVIVGKAESHSFKAANKDKLLGELNLKENDRPLLAMVSRLTVQKGIQLVLDIIPRLVSEGYSLVVLGTGERAYEDELTGFMALYPEQICYINRFDADLARGIYAAADIFLMPSLFEPCGIGQLIAMRYGTIPVARKTGGLKDTIVDYSTDTEKSTGFLFDKFSAEAFKRSIFKAAEVYSNKKEEWQRLRSNAVSSDFSWDRSADEYIRLYNDLINKHNDRTKK